MRHTIIAATILASISISAVASAQSTPATGAPTATGAAAGPNQSEAQPGKGKSKARAKGKTSQPGRTNEASRSPDVRGANVGTTGTTSGTMQPAEIKK